ncbi:hypothetical protein [Shinella zoogloeoides]|uniref:hypothetical protein n=1 Tax=Shinella zoogloeoides TaxID=352475 RepID=UPI00273F000A|nr:hypothetical protein [Shinella zoogloeoides]WLR90991.1 hypothetical protein Q9316_00145 [Shinella zoogloeoides]
MSEEALSGPDENAAGEDKKNRRLTDAEWAQIVESYELGIKGVGELADEFGVSRQNLSQRFKTHGIKRGSRAHEVQAAVQQAATNQAAAAAARAETFAAKRAAWIEETRLQGYQMVRNATLIAAKLVGDTVKSNASMASIDDDLKAIRRFQLTLIEGIDARLNKILRADETVDENELPELPLVDLTAEDIVRHHQDIGALDDETDIDALLKSVDQDLTGMVSS